MLDTKHILYIVISLVLSAALIALFRIFIKSERGHLWVIRAFALLTVALHYSPLFVDFFSGVTPEVSGPMLLPIHPCNVCMWLLLAAAFAKPSDSVAYRTLTEFVFWGGTVCGFIGILLNENYAANPTLLDYEVLKGLLSHSTMLIGCVYLLVSGIVTIRVRNVISVAAGLMLFIVDGAIINLLYAIFGLDPCNAMYLLEPPFSDLPWLTNVTMGLMGVAVAFAISALYEALALPKNERWYSKLKSINNKKRGDTV